MRHWVAVLTVSVGGALVVTGVVLARAGGGGSSSGGGGGGGGGLSGGEGSGETWFGFLAFIALCAFIVWVGRRHRNQRIAAAKAVVASAATTDARWRSEEILARVRDVFHRFQAAWSASDVAAFSELLTEPYRQRIVLELGVLQAEQRKNIVGNPLILRLAIISATDATGTQGDQFTAEIVAQAHDELRDIAADRRLYLDTSTFTEYWTFVRDGDAWRLSGIRQSTEALDLREQQIEAFAQRHGFHYDADFGWLMLPNQGFLFRKSNFKTSDINNHVIGYHREKVVEFYTFIPRTNQLRTARGFFVAQAVLPKRYHDILIRRRRWWSVLLRPRGLRRITLESPEFNRRFCLWAHPLDQANSLELLHPTFMERVASLPFALDIELVGNILYLATKDRQNAAQFDQMLDILNGAFDEMER